MGQRGVQSGKAKHGCRAHQPPLLWLAARTGRPGANAHPLGWQMAPPPVCTAPDSHVRECTIHAGCKRHRNRTFCAAAGLLADSSLRKQALM